MTNDSKLNDNMPVERPNAWPNLLVSKEGDEKRFDKTRTYKSGVCANCNQPYSRLFSEVSELLPPGLLEYILKAVSQLSEEARLELLGMASQWPSRLAYYWASNIGDKEIMIDRVTESEWAFKWAYNIGDEDIMIDRVTDSEWAYEWAKEIDDSKVVLDKITDSRCAYEWARLSGETDDMIDKVTDSQWAYMWALNIGNKEIMIDRVTEEKWVSEWSLNIGPHPLKREK